MHTVNSKGSLELQKHCSIVSIDLELLQGLDYLDVGLRVLFLHVRANDMYNNYLTLFVTFVTSLALMESVLAFLPFLIN